MKQVARAYAFFCVVGITIGLLAGSGCANIVPPGGGARDSLPPVLVAETPMDSARNVTTNRIVFTFNEYIELQNVQENVLVSPTPDKTPLIDYKLRTVTVRLRDTLEPNTTYSINFGNAIKDINEGNVFKDFSYVFSTGNTIDTFTLSGKVVSAETGKADSTLAVVLHKNLNDSAVIKERPRYVARVNGQGNYTFRNLPAGTFAVYAVPNTFTRSFNENEPFAFADKPVTISSGTSAVNLVTYIEKPRVAAGTLTTTPRPTRDQNKILRYTTNLEGSSLDLLQPLTINFGSRISTYDTNKITLTNKSFIKQSNYRIIPDSSSRRFSIIQNRVPNTEYNLIIAKDAFIDSAGATLANADTIRFTTKREEEYGNVKLRFNNLDFTKNPVLLILQNDAILQSVPLTQRDFNQKLFKPGEYSLRILYDANKNGRWDAGEFFGKHKQPEIVISLNMTLSVRANWDNEKEITL